MTSLLTTLGLLSTSPLHPPPSLAATSIIFQFIFTYCLTTPRFLNRYHGIDHNVNPREDLAKYGLAAVKSGKITQAQYNRLKRCESAHANGIEHFPFFAAAMVWAQVAGLPRSVSNRMALMYAVARVVYVVVYVTAETEKWSQLRGVCWWIGNVACMRLFWLGGKAINGGA